MTRCLVRLLQGVAVLVLVTLTACRADTDVAAPTATTPVSETPEPTAPTASAAPTTLAAPTASPPPTAPPAPTALTAPTASPPPTAAVPTSEPATPVPDLPGEPWELFVPLAGEIVAVVGVAHDDILEVHQTPGENSPLVGTLAPLAADLVSSGEGRSLPASIWWRITQGGLDGWVGSRFVSRLGVTDDITSSVIDSLGARPAAETMLDLGMIVADERKSQDPPSRVVVSVAPRVGDIGEITIDVVGLGDDAVEGERLQIFGQPLESGEGFSLMAVEATVMCSRGVTDSGLCL